MSRKKPQRRGRGSISVKGPGRWIVRVSYGIDATGKQRRKSEVIEGTRDDAEKRLTALLTEYDQNPDLAPSGDTVASWVGYWFEHLTGDLSPQTVSKARYAWDRYGAGTTLAKTPLGKLKAKDAQSYVNGLTQRGLGPVTVNYVARWLKAVLNQAVAMGELARNPMTDGKVKLPRIPKPEFHRLTVVEAQRFLKAAEEDRYHALWRLWLEATLRPNEATALKWSDLSPEGVLTVQRALVRIGPEVTFKETKTGTTQGIPLTTTTLKALRAHQQQQRKDRLALGPYWTQEPAFDGLMFPATGGTPLSIVNLARRHFKPLLKRAKLPSMRLYDLRHSSATLLLKAGASIKDVQTRCRHARAQLTMDFYLESDAESQRAATKKYDALLAV
jgi:integrase